MNLHSVHSILLAHEQRLQFQNSITEEETLSAHIASHSRTTQSRTSQNNRTNFSLHQQNGFSHPSRRGCPRGHGQEHRNNHSNNRPQCQLCGKLGHTVITCYHRFAINSQKSDVLASSSAKSASHTSTSSDVHAMMVSPSSTINDSWFLGFLIQEQLTS